MHISFKIKLPGEADYAAQPICAYNLMSGGFNLTISVSSQLPAVPKYAVADTSLTVDNADGGKTTFPVPSGTEVQFHLPALHFSRMSNLLPPQGPGLTEISQRSIGRTPTHFDRRDSLENGRGTRLCLLAQVGWFCHDTWSYLMK